MAKRKQKLPRLAVHKFSSCDGCQLTMLDLEEELLQIAERVEIAYFLEASRATSPGPYDLVLVEGSVSTPHDINRIKEARRDARFLVTIGACATAGGIQALRNMPGSDLNAHIDYVYPSPEFIKSLEKSHPVSDFVKVDFELRGCPISKTNLVETVVSFLHGRKPNVPQYAVCVECKLRGTVCLESARGTACLGSVTQAGCDALCPSIGRGCFGCFGPVESANTASLADRMKTQGHGDGEISRLYHGFTAWADPFRSEGIKHAEKKKS